MNGSESTLSWFQNALSLSFSLFLFLFSPFLSLSLPLLSLLSLSLSGFHGNVWFAVGYFFHQGISCFHQKLALHEQFSSSDSRTVHSSNLSIIPLSHRILFQSYKNWYDCKFVFTLFRFFHFSLIMKRRGGI